MRLLLIEDNEELSRSLIEAFKEAGHDVDAVTTIGEARSVLFAATYAAVLLDLGLPDGNGLTLLRELRRNNQVLPVLILSARGGVNDRVLGLRAGAQDYLVKPFDMEELIARVQVLLLRGAPGQSLKLGNLELIIDQHGRQVFIDGESQVLPPRDISILEVLLERPKRVVSKDILASHIGDPAEVMRSAIDVYVHRLRKVLENRGAKLSIETVPGVGYIMNEIR